MPFNQQVENEGLSPITFRYLTLITDLETLPQHSRGGKETPSDDAACPPPPDLERFASPLQWSRSQKNIVTWLSCFSTLITSYTPGAYTAGLDQYRTEWHLSETTIYAGVTVFTLCFAAAPMILAPFSELQGRRPVFVISGIIFVISQIGSGVTSSFAGMLITRALAGISCSVFSTVVGGVLSDIYTTSERNKPMVIFTGAAMCGTGLGPMVSGILVQHLSWRWIFYVQTITCGVVVIALTAFFKETRGSVILRRKVRTLNAWYDARERAGYVGLEELREGHPVQRVRWKVAKEAERDTVYSMIKVSLSRPLQLFFTESVVFWFSLWMAFAWSVLYMTFEALPLVFTTNHGFNAQQNGLVFSTIPVASLIAASVAIYQDGSTQRSDKEPEARLYTTCLQSTLLPIGLFWLGWTLFPSIHWIVPTLAVGCITLGIFSVYLAVSNYLADMYGSYASSAIAAQSFCRNVFAAAIPLFTLPLFRTLTFQGASSLLGGVGIAISLVPWILVRYGPSIRARSKIASEMQESLE